MFGETPRHDRNALAGAKRRLVILFAKSVTDFDTLKFIEINHKHHSWAPLIYNIYFLIILVVGRRKICLMPSNGGMSHDSIWSVTRHVSGSTM